MPRRVLVVTAALLGLAGCGNSDNQVNGGIFGQPQFPNGFILDVGSAIAGPYTRMDNMGHTFNVSMFILSDQPALCTQITGHADYFKNPSRSFVALVMTTDADHLGAFQIGASNGGTASMLVTAGPGNPVGTFTADLGTISLRQLGINPGGESDGSFDVGIVDATARRREIFGKFKTQGCAAITALQF